jgi:hypothetical protein
MIDNAAFDNFIFSDGQILSALCNFADSILEVKLQVRKRLGKQIVPCVVCLRFEMVAKFDVLENFGTSGYYSDVILVRLSDTQFYVSFDPFGNSGEPHERDNFVIIAADCKIDEISGL